MNDGRSVPVGVPPVSAATPSVSVVIPTFNRAEFLPTAVASVIRQSHPPIEILIVDDGSTDHTAKVCAAFQGPVRYIRQENRGAAAARNRGIAEARGEYVAFLDADDVWHPHKLEAQLASLAKFPAAAWCFTELYMLDPAGQPLRGRYGLMDAVPVFRSIRRTPSEHFGSRLDRRQAEVDGREYPLFVGDVFELLFLGNFVFPSAAILRREVVARVGGFDDGFRVAHDNEFFHRVAARFPCAVLLAPLTGYRTGTPEKLTDSRNTVQLIRNALESTRRASDLRELTDRERLAFLQGRRILLQRLAYAHVTMLEPHLARQALAEAQRLGGWTPRLLALRALAHLPIPLLRSLGAAKKAFAHGVPG